MIFLMVLSFFCGLIVRYAHGRAVKDAKLEALGLTAQDIGTLLAVAKA